MPSFCRQPGAFSSAQSLWGLVSDKRLDFLMGLVVHSPHRGVPSRPGGGRRRPLYAAVRLVHELTMRMGSRLRGVLLERVVAYDPARSCQRSTLRQGTRITCNMQLDGLGKGKLATAFAPPDDASDDDDDDGDSHSMPVLLVKGPRKGQHSLWPR